jgi:glycosyltransferase involved in cell wall biosynthesis
MPMRQPVFINGKFTAQRLTGVQRYAGELVRALDAQVAAGERWTLLVPHAAEVPELTNIEVRRVRAPGHSLHAWEQIVLPWAARSGLLLNLAGSAPLLARRQWCTFHDAAVFDHPDVFTSTFRRWYRFHFRWLARRAERLLTVSAYSRQRLAVRLGLPEARIGIVPNGAEHLERLVADPGLLARLGLAGCRWFLAVGSNSRLKNWPALLQAWGERQRADGERLVLVGGSNGAVFAAGGAPAASAAGVLHAGVVTDAELRALMEGALALVMPSLDEGFGLPVAEAMALGCPVAAARAGALPEVAGDAALYFEPTQPAQIGQALERLAADAPLRARLAARGRARAAALSWPESAAALRRLLVQRAVAA